MKKSFGLIFSFCILIACENPVDDNKNKCGDESQLRTIDVRNFNMGFTTWPFGPNADDIEGTYQFISENADIYAEHLDNKIPWHAWINSTSLPQEFVNDISYRVSKKIPNLKLLLSVSLLNNERSDLIGGYNGQIPDYTAMNDQTIEDAYVKHLEYLIEAFDPDYLLLAIEVNELKIKSEAKWDEYKLLMKNVRERIRNKYAGIKISESVTLHNWFEPDVDNKGPFISEISDYVNQDHDFTAISYYPFFKGQHTAADFQKAFDFLHGQTSLPLAFVETSHLAEELEVESYNLLIPGDECEQNTYLETLLLNAFNNNYEFIIWWAHRDFDALWEIFPESSKDLGKLWRDTGILDEQGEERPAYDTWINVFGRY